ncbi:hypothetical protein [Friedmanniella luteola]|uniref:hypothetical protein n=1 Tax=Friedmanniella luteola TaxID=546871 RepID=UPI000B88F869|nr:hypothetical protein [Friedmanniella luteola]
MTGEEREALEAAIPLLRDASVLTRLGRGVPNGLAGHVLAVGIDIAADDAVELLLPDRMTPRPPPAEGDAPALLRAAEQLLAQLWSAARDRRFGDLCDEVSELVAEAAGHAVG